ncbi:MAG: hypothetical protein JNL57_04595 [Bacteroidetes bacterium]|nr:hypothetical protein [Bacteroidota bacterium]
MRLFLLFSLLTVTRFLGAQSEKMTSLGVGLNRNGFGAVVKIYKPDHAPSNRTMGDFRFELGNITHSRELPLLNTTLQSSSIYKFGKINYVWAFRPAWETRWQLAPRPDKKAVGIQASAGVGLPMAWAWPVYIRLFTPDPGGNEVFSIVRYNPDVHPQSQIAGRAPFHRGFSQGQLIPGLSLHTAVEFMWGNYRTDVNIVTIGARIEAWSKKLPILYTQNQNKSVLPTFYIGYAFGLGG